jgi:hypothetical protein
MNETFVYCGGILYKNRQWMPAVSTL